jgi:tRNA A-37 threonylcarbamoyl transferase component Bud32
VDLLKAEKMSFARSKENQIEAPLPIDIESPSSSSGHGPRDSIPGYKIVRKLSEGGQGVVYQAIQVSTRRKVAIKMIREGAFASRSAIARFEREVQILARLSHPNIVTIHESGTATGGHYFVMDYIAGQPLDEYMQCPDAPGSIREILQLFETICNAVNAAHLAGIIHRDLKPSNVRIDGIGVPHILDFGLAKVALSDSEASMMTMTGQFMGSLPWASPEQAMGMPGKIDMRTDVYSLGVIMYQMLTGEFPYQVTGNIRSVLEQIMRTEPRRASTLHREINDEVDTIVLKCLSKVRERRYQTAGELARDVQHYLSGQPIEAKRDSFGYLMRKQLMRHKVPVVVGVGFIAVILIGLVASLTLWRRAVAERENARFHLETARTEVIKSFEEYQAIIPQLRRAEDLAALLPREVHERYPQGSPEASYREATEWITGLFPSTLDSVPVTGYATLNTQTRDAVQAYARRAGQPGDPVAAAWIRANQDGVTRLVEATKQHRFNLGTSSEGGLLVDNLLPSLKDVRFGVEVLTASAVVHHGDGNGEMAIENLDAAVRISRYVGDGATLINRLVEIYCRNIIHNAYRWMVADAVANGQLPPAYVVFMRHAPPLPDFEHGHISEVRALRQILNEAFVKTSDRAPARLDLGRLRPLADEWEVDENPYANPSEAMIADAKTLGYEQAVSIITEFCDRLRVQQNASFLEIKAEGDRMEKQLEDEHPALILLMPTFTRALELLREARMNRDATVIAVAIGVFRHTQGEWPESIDDALALFELEPYHRNYYGHDFVYRIVDNEPLLYAVGPNGIDDGGQGRRYESKSDTANASGDDVLFLVPETE